jgi:hypothetical protein
MGPTRLALLLMAASLAGLCGGCSRRTEHRGAEDGPYKTYRRAVDGADSAASRAGRRAAGMDSASEGAR